MENRTGAPVLAIIPHVSKRKGGTKVITVADPGSEAAEAYRGLRTRLLYAASKGRVKSVIITSSEAGEGKTTTAVNLAVSLTQAEKRVILVSADLRRPGLERYFPNSNGTGLVNVISGELKPVDAMFWTGLENLWLLPSGPHSATPAEILGSTAMTELIKQLEASADFVLIDTTPVLGLSDALNIAPMTDSVLFVADANRASRAAIQEATHQLISVGASLIGVVLTNFEPSKLNPYYPHYGRYYHRPPSEPTLPLTRQDAVRDGQYT
jgi:capsular exopolysaccharide synthesis family protein